MTVKEVAAFLRAHDSYLILTHRRPDGDTLGCAAALCAMLRQMGKTAALLPNAEVKIYLTASPKVRAQRRVDQLKEKGQNADYDAVLREVCERDERDMNRAISPLRRADDAHLVDSSDMTIPEVVAAIMKYVNQAEAKADDADI